MIFESRCPDAASARPRAWHPHQTTPEDSTVICEIAAVLTSDSPTRAELEGRVADLRALVTEAERGELGGDDWKPVHRDPTLWEIRQKWGAILLRGYFHEPGHITHQTVLAHVHRKDTSGDITSGQNRAIDTASLRIARERDSEWGLGFSTRLYG